MIFDNKQVDAFTLEDTFTVTILKATRNENNSLKTMKHLENECLPVLLFIITDLHNITYNRKNI